MQNNADGEALFRRECDSIGSLNIPKDVYYGIQTLRAAETFRVTGLSIAS